MQTEQMREAFEAWWDMERARVKGADPKAIALRAYAAGMERAAEICEYEARGHLRAFGGGEKHEAAQFCAAAIRAEIKEKG